MTAFIQHAANAIAAAEALLITAGAGMSVDSGLPDYRGPAGLWNDYPLYRELKLDYAALTRPSGFERDPQFAWGFHGHCLNLYREARPHAGYEFLRALTQHFGDLSFVLTTNVDGLFLKAGFDSSRLRECHGSLHRLQCLHPCERVTWSADSFHPEIDFTTMRLRSPLPTCATCRSIARPAVFAFGDTRYVWEDTEHQSARYQAWKQRVAGKRLVVIECGSGPDVPGLRREGEAVARVSQGRLIRVNPSHADATHPHDINVAERALPALTAIEQLISLQS